MKAGKHGQLWSDAVRPSRAFTLVELLVVIGVIAFLAMLHVSARAGIRRHTKVAMCANNVRMITFALHRYANDNNEKLPVVSYMCWPWDLTPSVADTILRYDLQTNTFYCPGTLIRFNEADFRNLWNFTPHFRTTGYAFALAGSPWVFSSNQNTTLLPEPVPIGNPPERTIVPNSQRVLVADATISAPGQADPAQRYRYNYTAIFWGYMKLHMTPHLEGLYPVGGNLGMIDGHVEWRKFDDMTVRAGGSIPTFWW